MANKERGEVSITLNGKEYVMRPTYQACIEIEQATGTGLVLLARRVTMVEHGLSDAVAIITAGLKAGGEVQANPAAVGEMIMKTGLINLSAPLTEFLTNALTGGEEPKPGEDQTADQTASHTEDSPLSPMQT